MAHFSPGPRGDETGTAAQPEVSSHDDIIDAWLAGKQTTGLKEFRVIYKRLDAQARRLRDEAWRIREELRLRS